MFGAAFLKRKPLERVSWFFSSSYLSRAAFSSISILLIRSLNPMTSSSFSRMSPSYSFSTRSFFFRSAYRKSAQTKPLVKKLLIVWQAAAKLTSPLFLLPNLLPGQSTGHVLCASLLPGAGFFHSAPFYPSRPDSKYKPLSCDSQFHI